MTNLIEAEPSSYEEVVDHQVWKYAMIEEYQSILKNDVLDVVPRPEGKNTVTSKWIYKIKHAVDGSVEKFKARFMARGFSQKEGEYYDGTFAPVATYTSIRSIIALASITSWKSHQLDVKMPLWMGLLKKKYMLKNIKGLRFIIERPIYLN